MPYISDLAYLIITEHGATLADDLPEQLRHRIEADLETHAAWFARDTDTAPTYLIGHSPHLRNQDDLARVINLADKEVQRAIGDGWLPTDAPKPF